MALLDYTSYETIRAVVGLAETELPDGILALGLYEREVIEALDTLNPELRVQFAVVLAVLEANRTLLQRRFVSLMSVYAAYFVGKVLAGGSIELFAPVKIQDGKAVQERVDDPFTQLRADIQASLTKWEGMLLRCLALIDPTQVVATRAATVFMASAGLAVNPVTGAA